MSLITTSASSYSSFKRLLYSCTYLCMYLLLLLPNNSRHLFSCTCTSTHNKTRWHARCSAGWGLALTMQTGSRLMNMSWPIGRGLMSARHTVLTGAHIRAGSPCLAELQQKTFSPPRTASLGENTPFNTLLMCVCRAGPPINDTPIS